MGTQWIERLRFLVLLPAILLAACGRNGGSEGGTGAFTLKGDLRGSYLDRFGTSGSPSLDGFGTSVALSNDGGTLAVGAMGDASLATGINSNQMGGLAARAGAAYIFVQNGGVWEQQAYIKASNTDGEDLFGKVLALSGDGNTLAVGAEGEDSAATGINGNQSDNTAYQAGAVYLFTRNDDRWEQQAYIKASNTEPDDRFGMFFSLSSDGNTLAVGTIFESSAATGINGNQADNAANAAGAVYLFTRSGDRWAQQAYIKASTANSFDLFGDALALSNEGDILAVGAPGNDSSGAVYLFTRSGDRWEEQAYIKPSNAEPDDYFGGSLALSDDNNTLMVGALSEDGSSTGINGNQDNWSTDAGAIYHFARESNGWAQKNYIKPSNVFSFDRFGNVFALSGNGHTLVARGLLNLGSTTSPSFVGVFHPFTIEGNIVVPQGYVRFSTSKTMSGDISLSLNGDGNRLVVGVSGESRNSPWMKIDGNPDNNKISGIGKALNSVFLPAAEGAVFIYER